MIASELISQELIALKTSDTGHAALAVMGDFYVKHLPIVNNRQYLGLISEEDILDNPMEEPIGSYALNLPKTSVNHKSHLFEIMNVMAEFRLTVIPVTDDDGNFMGVITQEDLLQFYANSFSFSEPGHIIVLEVSRSDYSLAEISRLVESENGTVFSSFINTNQDTNQVYVTLKINRIDVEPVARTLERFGFKIKASYVEEEYINSLKERYDLLMNYLNV